MQISQMMRSVIGDAKPTDAKALELKAGQVVRGMVMQWLSNQDALVQIEGVQVKARLEAALEKGQAALLQVMANSKDGTLALQLLTALNGSNTASIDDLLLKLGMKPNDVLREMALALRQAGLDVSKENMQAMRNVLEGAPQQAARSEWLQTGALALAKGLPLEPQPLAALSRAVFGPPVGQSLANLAEAVQTLLAKPQSGMTQQTGALLQELAGRLHSLLQSVEGWSGGRQNTQQAPPQAPTGNTAPAASASGSVQAAAATSVNNNTLQQQASMSSQATQGSTAASPAPQPAANSGTAAQTGSAPIQQQASNQTAEQAATARSVGQPAAEGTARTGSAPVTAPASESQAAVRPTSADSTSRTASMNTETATNAERTQPTQTAAMTSSAQASATEQSWLPRMLKLIGFDHENQALRMVQAAMQDGPEGNTAPLAALPDSGDGARLNELASLKSVLLQLGAADDLPLTLREPVQQLLQQVTGQQLLLTPDRSGNFAHVTLFVPFHDKDGQQSAAIHIQSRKSRNGGIDADNCRLWFDLNMSALGPTLVDVQVTDKRVNVRLFNDHPAMAVFADQGKEHLTAVLAETGFQLLTFSQSSYPEARGESGSDPTSGEQDKIQQLLERNKPYKGVDFRI